MASTRGPAPRRARRRGRGREGRDGKAAPQGIREDVREEGEDEVEDRGDARGFQGLVHDGGARAAGHPDRALAHGEERQRGVGGERRQRPGAHGVVAGALDHIVRRQNVRGVPHGRRAPGERNSVERGRPVNIFDVRGRRLEASRGAEDSNAGRIPSARRRHARASV